MQHTNQVNAEEKEDFSTLKQRLSQLKKEKNVFLPAHYYQPEDVKAVADFVGDSLELARKCKESDADTILFAGVYFMAETAKIVNQSKKVLIPSLEAGCSLADSITAENVRRLKKEHPGAPVVCYVNTSAAVKAESDVCCTSANYLKIIETLPQQKVIFVPDTYMAQNIAGKTSKQVIGWNGECVVHKDFTPERIDEIKECLPDIEVLVHIECPPKVVGKADYVGSTSGMRKHISQSQAKDYFILTECGMIDTLKEEFPGKSFHTPCSICPYMKKITLEGLIWSLETGKHEVIVPETTRIRAKKSLDRMFKYS